MVEAQLGILLPAEGKGMEGSLRSAVTDEIDCFLLAREQPPAGPPRTRTRCVQLAHSLQPPGTQPSNLPTEISWFHPSRFCLHKCNALYRYAPVTKAATAGGGGNARKRRRPAPMKSFIAKDEDDDEDGDFDEDEEEEEEEFDDEEEEEEEEGDWDEEEEDSEDEEVIGTVGLVQVEHSRPIALESARFFNPSWSL
jgi:hypothetical protein